MTEVLSYLFIFLSEHGSNYITISRDAAGSFVTSDGMTLVEVPTTITTEELLITQEGATDNSSETVALLHAPSLGGEPST